MAHLKKHPGKTVVGVAVAVLLVAGLWHFGVSSRAAMLQASPYDPIDPLERAGALTLLDQLSLDTDAMIALHLTGEQAESVLSTVRTWHGANLATLATRKAAIDSAVYDVRVLKKAIALGPYDPTHATDLAAAREALADAQSGLATTHEVIRASVNALLSSSQQATWSAIQTGHGQTMPIRMLDLTAEQRVAVSKAHRRYRRTRATARTNEARDAAVSTRRNEMDTIYTTAQRAVIDSYHSNYAADSATAVSARDAVLPVDQG